MESGVQHELLPGERVDGVRSAVDRIEEGHGHDQVLVFREGPPITGTEACAFSTQ